VVWLFISGGNYLALSPIKVPPIQLYHRAANNASVPTASQPWKLVVVPTVSQWSYTSLDCDNLWLGYAAVQNAIRTRTHNVAATR